MRTIAQKIADMSDEVAAAERLHGQAPQGSAVREYSPELTAYRVWQESAQKLSYDRWVDNPNQW